MRVLVTGSRGFIGRHLVNKLRELGITCLEFHRGKTLEELDEILEKATVVIHLAGKNRSKDLVDFEQDNHLLTKRIATTLENISKTRNKPTPVIYSSSIQAGGTSPYAITKVMGEESLIAFGQRSGARVVILRLPNVFGKWSKPNHNSVVATFCANAWAGADLQVHKSAGNIDLLYIDDLVNQIMDKVFDVQDTDQGGLEFPNLNCIQQTLVSELASTLGTFRHQIASGLTPVPQNRLQANLLSTLIASMPSSEMVKPLRVHRDARGSFTEILKFAGSSQVSVVECAPNSVRGEHYHNSKFEFFQVVYGSATFRFRNLLDGQIYEHEASSSRPELVTAPPGWVHSIENHGGTPCTVLVWANELFDESHPDTIKETI